MENSIEQLREKAAKGDAMIIKDKNLFISSFNNDRVTSLLIFPCW